MTGCRSWLQFKLLIDLIFESVHSERRQSLPPSLLAKQVDSIIIRDQTACAFSTVSLETQLLTSPFHFAKFLIFISSRSSSVYMQGDVAHNMYPIPAVCQRIFHQLIQILQ